MACFRFRSITGLASGFKNNLNWTLDNFGPLWIPAKGATIPINDSTLALLWFYHRQLRS
jgi:hypothetical protein